MDFWFWKQTLYQLYHNNCTTTTEPQQLNHNNWTTTTVPQQLLPKLSNCWLVVVAQLAERSATRELKF